MALISTYKSYRLINFIRSIRRKSLTVATVRAKSILIDLDVLDDFTTQLMQKKTDKWESIKVKKLLPPTPVQIQPINKRFLPNQFERISIIELNTIFESHLDENDQLQLLELIKECITYKKSPSNLIITNTLTSLAQAGNIEGISKIEELCSLTNQEYLKEKSNLKHYLAEATWLKGNVIKAIDIFEDVYDENPFLRRTIRLILRYLISVTISNHSEAVLVNLVSFTERLVVKYKDYSIMSALWQICFLSEWFSDQQVAFDLIQRNSNLSKRIINQIPYVVSISLKNHRMDPVYRLLEILLQNQMKMQSSIVLVALFDYRFRQGDLKSCWEILNWSTKYKIMLPSIQQEKFLRLLLKGETADYKDKRGWYKYDLKF